MHSVTWSLFVFLDDARFGLNFTQFSFYIHQHWKLIFDIWDTDTLFVWSQTAKSFQLMMII